LYQQEIDAGVFDESISLNPAVIAAMQLKGFDREFIEISLVKNRRNNVATTYYLLLKKEHRLR
jgi:hypothetical protein